MTRLCIFDVGAWIEAMMFQVHKTGARHVSIKLTIVLFYQGHACTVMDSPETRTRCHSQQYAGPGGSVGNLETF